MVGVTSFRNNVTAVLAGASVLAAGTALLVCSAPESDAPGSGGGQNAGGQGSAQGPLTMGEPTAVYGVAFSTVSTVRELPDGRVLVADALGQALVRVDMDGGAADTIGGVGEGPEEYRQPDAAWPLPDGRTLLVDLGNGRLTELGADLSFGRTQPYSVGDVEQGQIVMVLPQGVDDRGRAYFRELGVGGPRDSAAVLRYDFETEAVDQVARFKRADLVTESDGAGNERISQVPRSPADAWGVAPDGRVVVARVGVDGAFHVEWVSEEGVVRGPPVPYDPIRLGRSEMERWDRERMETGGGMSISVSVTNGMMTLSASRGASEDDETDFDALPWPDVLPAFYSVRVIVDPAGRAWVRRFGDGDDPPLYDLFNGAGERVASVELAPGRRVVDFGQGVAYVIALDEFGLQTLERYALPGLVRGPALADIFQDPVRAASEGPAGPAGPARERRCGPS